MEYIIAVFTSRTQTMEYYQILSSYKVRCSIINTPKQAKFVCGISIKMPLDALKIAISIFNRRKFSAFSGFYKVYENYPTFIINPILK